MFLRSMVSVSVLIVSLEMVIPGCSWGQGPNEEATADDGIFANIDDEQPNPAEAKPGDEPAAASDKNGEQTVEFPPHPNPEAAAALAVNAKVHELRERVVELETLIDELKAEVKLLRQAQTRLVDTEDFSTRALGAMSEDGDLRGHMGRMLQGKVRLTNNTGQSQVIYINGTAWTVVTGESYVLAPVGTVSFQHSSDDDPILKDVQEWRVNDDTSQLELYYTLGDADVVVDSDDAIEQSVLKKLPSR